MKKYKFSLLHLVLQLLLLPHGPPVPLIPRDPVYPVGHHNVQFVQSSVAVVHSQSSLVLLFQIFARLLEVTELPPTCLSGAGSTDSVTLAQGLHGLPDGHPPGLAVVEVGQGPGVGPSLARVQELSGHDLAKLDIVTAASPLPLRRISLGAQSSLFTFTML